MVLDEVEARVLGSLIEKDVSTPDSYPLSLNGLVIACNQRSNRDPLMSLDEDAVRLAIRGLEKHGLAGPADTFDGRVTKYEHRLQEVFNLDRRETALLCTLLLRGPQTRGELRSRSERMHRFDDAGEVESTLERLQKRDPQLVRILPRQPGTKEPRYAHLLCGDLETRPQARTPEPQQAPLPPAADRLSQMAQEIAQLQSEITELKRQFSDFRKQFE